MRYIRIPENVVARELNGDAVVDPETKEVVKLDFVTFARGRAADASIFGGTLELIQSSARLIESLRPSVHDPQPPPGDVWQVESDDWDNLVRAVKTPQGGYVPQIAVNCVGFMTTILEAPDKLAE